MSGPWTVAQRRVVVAADVAGAALVVVALVGSAGTNTLEQQYVWLNVAVSGLALSAMASGSWLYFGRRTIGLRLATLLPAPDEPSTHRPHVETGWVWLQGTRRGHRPSCPLVAGKPVAYVDDREIACRGLLRCEVCGEGSRC